MKLIAVLLVILASPGVNALNCEKPSQDVLITGVDISKQIPDINANVTKVWKIVLEITGTNPETIKAPTVEFSSFLIGKQRPEWTKWQEEWIQKNPEVGFYKDGFEKKVAIAYHYAGTNKVQLNPEHEHGFIEWARDISKNFSWGNPLESPVRTKGKFLKAQYHGFGYFYLGHEFLHYVLEKKGVHQDDQHCVMLKKEGGNNNLETRLAEKLIAADMTFAFVIQTAIRPEEYIFADQCKE